MVRRSLLGSSRQLWKLYLSLILIILGGLQLLIAIVNMERHGLLFVFGALLLVAIGLLGGGLFIRCPKCGAKLLWKALTDAPASRWLHWLLTFSHCPVCGEGK